MVLGAFAGIGLILVITGVFSVTAYSVSLQTQEIGIRMALGARRESVLAMVLARGARLLALGIVAGELASLVLTRLLASQMGRIPSRPVNPREHRADHRSRRRAGLHDPGTEGVAGRSHVGAAVRVGRREGTRDIP